MSKNSVTGLRFLNRDMTDPDRMSSNRPAMLKRDAIRSSGMLMPDIVVEEGLFIRCEMLECSGTSVGCLCDG